MIVSLAPLKGKGMRNREEIEERGRRRGEERTGERRRRIYAQDLLFLIICATQF